MENADAGKQLLVFGYGFDLTIFFSIQYVVLQVAIIQRMRLVYPLKFFLMRKNRSIFTFAVVFTVVVVQMGVNDDVDGFG